MSLFIEVRGKYSDGIGFSAVGWLLHRFGLAVTLETMYPFEELLDRGFNYIPNADKRKSIDCRLAQIEWEWELGKSEYPLQLLLMLLTDEKQVFSDLAEELYRGIVSDLTSYLDANAKS